MKKFWIILAIVSAITASVSYSLFLKKTNFSDTRKPPEPISNSSKREIIGFLPYWNLDRLIDFNFNNLTTVYYFDVALNDDGAIDQSSPGWRNLHSDTYQKVKERIKRSKIRYGISIANLDPDSIAKNINNSTRQTTLIDSVIKIMKDESFQDLNVDLEYTGSFDPDLKKYYLSLVSNLTDTVHQQIPGSTVSIDAFADTIIKPRIFDLPAIGSKVDAVIIMAYDFHRLDSIKAGPIAPLFGKEKYGYDVTSAVTDFQKFVPSQKILLGIPFYGYEWPTENDQKDSFTIWSPQGSEISSYRRSLETANQNNAIINFDDKSKSPWFAYYSTPSGTWRQVWFENERSIGLKLNLVNQASLSGIAIFALGYDGQNSQSLWQEIKNGLK